MNCINDIYTQDPHNSYFIAREYPLLRRETETLYQDSQNGITTSSDYYYDNPEHTYPTRIAQLNSYGDSIKTQLKYPLDYNWDNLYTPNAINENYKLEITNLINTYSTCRSNLYNQLATDGLSGGYCCISGDYTKVKNYNLDVANFNCKSNFVITSNAIYSEKSSLLSNYLTNLNNSIAGSKPSWQKAILWMRRENVLSPVIEKFVSIKKKDDNKEYLISALRNNYSILNNNGVVKISVDAAEFSGNLLKSTFISNPENYYKTKFNFTYSNKFQLTSQIGPDLIPTSYLWGYQGMYPIAEVVNSTYDVVSNSLAGSTVDQLSNAISPDMNVVNNIRNNPNLKKALVSTYTYQPLVGMTSSTDPRGVTTNYSYDTFNRLYLTRDNDKNILGRYRYGYQNAPDNGQGGYTSITATVTPGSSSYVLTTTGTASVSNVTGGSGNYTYNWYLKNAGGAVLASNLNTNSTSFSYTCSQTGSFTLQCMVTDTQTGVALTASASITVTPQAFSMQSGYTSISYSLQDYGTYVSFYLMFYPSSVMYGGTSFWVATITANCRPSSTRSITYSTGSGRTWRIDIYTNGNVFFTLLSGPTLAPYSAVSFGTLTYNL